MKTQFPRRVEWIARNSALPKTSLQQGFWWNCGILCSDKEKYKKRWKILNTWILNIEYLNICWSGPIYWVAC